METIVNIILQSGKSAIEVSLYVLLPIMVLMMALMHLLEVKGALAYIARLLSPILSPLGIPGVGVFAALQSLLVSFAAPVAALAIMERDGTNRRRIAATLAMVLTMSQANVVFPMLTVGLNLWVVLGTSIVGGVIASTLTYYFFARAKGHEVNRAASEITQPEAEADTEAEGEKQEKDFISILLDGGWEGVKLALKSIPILVMAFCLVNSLKATGIISFVAGSLAPYLNWVGLSGMAVLPAATKFLAGGTAMMGVTVDLVKEGAMTPQEVNLLAGLLMNPLDLVGVAVLISPGPRVRSVILPAMMGAAVGVMVRSLLHVIIFR